jgi:hypothetical protein
VAKRGRAEERCFRLGAQRGYIMLAKVCPKYWSVSCKLESASRNF